MRQLHLDSAVARATGESLRTIQQRGFGLARLDSDRSARRATAASGTPHCPPERVGYSEDDLMCLATDC